MKTLKTLFIAILVLAIVPLNANAQTADEIINNYFENTGGLENWNKLETVKYDGEINMQGMAFPFVMFQTKEGQSMTKANVQGQEFFQEVFDGEVLWGTNQMTMAAEKSDSETTENFKNRKYDFPDPFLNYKEKGYAVELIGNETIDGTDSFKIKLTKKPIKVDGVETEDVAFYYFDTENFVPIVMEQEITSGPGKGMIIQVKYSDYEEVDGLYLSFSLNQAVKGQQGGTTISMKKIEINPEIDMAMFAFPEAPAKTEEGK